jgi:hypothetical protein
MFKLVITHKLAEPKTVVESSDIEKLKTMLSKYRRISHYNDGFIFKKDK